MFRRPTPFYLGRVTATAAHFRKQHTVYGPTSPITRATGHAFTLAVRAALTRGEASFDQVAIAAGLTDPNAVLGVEDVDLSRLDRADGLDSRCAEVRAELDRPITQGVPA